MRLNSFTYGTLVQNRTGNPALGELWYIRLPTRVAVVHPGMPRNITKTNHQYLLFFCPLFNHIMGWK